MTSFTFKITLALTAAAALVLTVPSTDAFVASGTRCFRQSNCLDFKVRSCNQGDREVCILWNKNAGCDKFWSQPFPDVCTYTPADATPSGEVEVLGTATFKWLYGYHKRVCQNILATGDAPAAYFSVRGYVDCDGSAEKVLTNKQWNLGKYLSVLEFNSVHLLAIFVFII